jgi:DNA invertase Pin-like site-specific DNA recombinase
MKLTMSSTNAVRAAVYCRISHDQDDERQGVERQRQDCLRVVERNGWVVVPDGTSDTFTDNDVSGAVDITERPAGGRLVAAMRAGKVNAVVAYTQARIYRDTAKFLGFCELLRTQDVETLALVADADVNPDGSLFVATIIAAKDAEYRRSVGELGRRKKVELAEQGKPSGGGIRAFGFNWPHGKGTDRYVEPDPDAEPYSIYEPEAKAIRWAYRHILDEDGTIKGVQREWTSRGLPTIRGGTWWHRTSIHRILTGARIAGLRVHKGKVMEGVVASWEAIVTRERWEAMCAILNDPTRANRPHTPVSRQYPLRGLLLCGVCGRRMSGTNRNTPRGSSRYYYCRKDTGGCQEGGAWVAAEHIEAWVIGLVIGVAQSSDALDMIQAESGVLADELRALVAERNETQRLLDALEDKFARDKISENGYDRSRKAFQATVRAAEDRISAIEASSALGRVEGSLMTAWGKLSAAEQRRTIVSLVAEVTVMPKPRKGGNRFDSSRAKISWRSSALTLAAGMDEWPDADEVYTPQDVMQQVIARTVAATNVANAREANVPVPALVQDVVTSIHP